MAVLNPRKRRKRRTPAEARAEQTAYHEAAHAVVAHWYGFEIAEIVIPDLDDEQTRPRICYYLSKDVNDAMNGVVESLPFRHHVEAQSVLRVLFAGPLAQIKYEDRRSSTFWIWITSAACDRAAAGQLAKAMVDQESVPLLLRIAEREARRLLRDPDIWRWVQALAAHLTPGTVLSGQRVAEIIEGATGKRVAA
jgi:hypothetical protein